MSVKKLDINCSSTMAGIKKDRLRRLENLKGLDGPRIDMNKNNSTVRKYVIKHLSILFTIVMCIPIVVAIVVNHYLISKKHIDSGTPYIRDMNPNGYLLGEVKLSDGTTWDILCVDNVKTIFDVDNSTITKTTLTCN